MIDTLNLKEFGVVELTETEQLDTVGGDVLTQLWDKFWGSTFGKYVTIISAIDGITGGMISDFIRGAFNAWMAQDFGFLKSAYENNVGWGMKSMP